MLKICASDFIPTEHFMQANSNTVTIYNKAAKQEGSSQPNHSS